MNRNIATQKKAVHGLSTGAGAVWLSVLDVVWSLPGESLFWFRQALVPIGRDAVVVM